LWWLANDSALSKTARDLIRNPENVVFVSAVSHWEIWLKQSLGKLRIPEEFERRLADESFESLPLTAVQAREVARLPWHHRDPFDRILIAQAKAENLVLLTADSAARAYGDFVLLAR
jgi:PIN domain nuclease of toxin-antitoxin system